ncbi:MAG: glycosyltransferase family 25 protein, partial [bacterium]|nr:glycosyltransferase family 25 protein [bacterium]
HLFRSNDFQYRRGVIGCALSHYRIWQRVAGDDGVRNALVFEDDVLFVRDFPRLYQELLAALPEDYDLVYVGGYPLDAAQEAALRGGDETALPPPDEYVGERIDPRLGVPRRTDIGTFAYLISRAGAGKLCARVKAHGFHRAVDYFLMDCWPDLRVYAAVPFLCWSVWEGSSDIQNDRESLFGEHRPGDLS